MTSAAPTSLTKAEPAGLRDPDDAPAGQPGPSAELRGVVKRYGTTTAVDGIDLVVGEGEFLSLLGPSGCGKTSTLRVLAGFEVPDQGQVLIRGTDVASMPAHRRPVNTVFQHYALFPHLSVAENVAFGLRMAKTGKAETATRVNEALDMVHLQPLARRKPKQLSGGQQQRVALARALVNRPQLLLLDEPLGALDRKLRQEMQIELKLLQTQVGITFVYVTHDQEEALSMSDRIAVMLDGRIEQLDSPDVVYDSPATAFVAGFLGQQNFIPGTSNDAGQTVDAPEVRLRAGHVAPGVTDGEVLAAVRPEFIELHTQRPTAPENTVPGTLVSVSHLGDVLQFVVATQAVPELLVRHPRATADRLLPGDQVWCSWPTRCVHVFPITQASLVLPESTP